MTTALARSNNAYFGALGSRLGFERVSRYAHMLGLGEKAGLDIAGEQPGDVAAEPPKGGMILMTAYGEGIQMTPLELAALLSAIANGGTLYYLQYPHTPGGSGALHAAGEAPTGPGAQRHRRYQNGHARRRSITAPRAAPPMIPMNRFSARPAPAPIFVPAISWAGLDLSMKWTSIKLVVVVMLASPRKGVNGPLASGRGRQRLPQSLQPALLQCRRLQPPIRHAADHRDHAYGHRSASAVGRSGLPAPLSTPSHRHPPDNRFWAESAQNCDLSPLSVVKIGQSLPKLGCRTTRVSP